METNTEKPLKFQEELQLELDMFIEQQKSRFPLHETIKIDLHCHDYNSDVPDELLGRILNVPETWLATDKLVEALEQSGCNLITITNHNNARSCYELQKLGKDVLVAAEFSVTVPDYNIGIHVLTYGFTPEQEVVLNKLRKNVYQFLQYAKLQNIPTIWAHPLYHYSAEGIPNFEFFRKMVLIFERFEVLNGQRDTWQNMLVKLWLESISPEQIDADAEYFGVDVDVYCYNRYRKVMTAGSDSHMGIFSGQTGSYLHIPDLETRKKTTPLSELALEAIRVGNIAPYGSHQNSEKLTVALLDYVFQIAMYKKDPGLLRIVLHKGSARDKVIALLTSNAFSELRRHKVTMKFVELFHNCFLGKVPSNTKRLFLPKEYKPVFDEAQKIARARFLPAEEMSKQYFEAINSISDKLNVILFERLTKKMNKLFNDKSFENINIGEIIENLEISSDFRTLLEANSKKKKEKGKPAAPNFAEFLDGLSFPFLASGLILGANYTSARVLYKNRTLLKTFAEKIGRLQHPKRMLWLTDTFDDKNGVSSVLQEMHKEIKKYNLPIDILVCSNTVQPDDHLIVVKPMAEITLPFYKEQSVRFPNFNEIHNMFLNNEYDRIMCSTEGIMGVAGLYLKNAYSVPAYFYVHTDWIMFARKVLGLDIHNINRLRRFTRAYYGAFDKLFVLNSDHKKWLTGKEMEFADDKVCRTAHWVDERFRPQNVSKQTTFGIPDDSNVLLFAGRLSPEKGVFDIADVYEVLREQNPKLKLVFAGTGPSENELRKRLPDATFLGWVDNSKLPEIYSAADLLVLASRFDTFSCVVLEALSCGLPVIAYKAKGPKDIIKNHECGYLVSGKKDMMFAINDYFKNPGLKTQYSTSAILRAKDFSKSLILKNLLQDVGLK